MSRSGAWAMRPKPRPNRKPEDGHSFFDLTDVLGDALLETGEGEEMHDATNVVEKIQSVDELFNAFREGVEQQVKGDDYDTHYNLGIAYKEMMLLEPAMEEFKKAMRDPERTLECCSMLSICETAQGNLDAAAEWLRQGIDAPGFPRRTPSACATIWARSCSSRARRTRPSTSSSW